MLLNPAFRVGIDVAPETVLTPVARVTATLASNTAKGSGLSLLVFDSVVEDDGWSWSTGTQFTVPAGVEVVVATAMIRPTGSDRSDDRLDLQLNAVTVSLRALDDHFWRPEYERIVLAVTPGDVLRWQLSCQSCTLEAGKTRVSFTGY